MVSMILPMVEQVLASAGYCFPNTTHENYDGYTVTIVDQPELECDDDEDQSAVVAVISSHYVHPQTGYFLMLQVERKLPAGAGIPSFYVWGYGPVPPKGSKTTRMRTTMFYDGHYMLESAVHMSVNYMRIINEVLPLLDSEASEETVLKHALANPITKLLAPFHRNVSEETRILLALHGENRNNADFFKRPFREYETVCQYLDIKVSSWVGL